MEDVQEAFYTGEQVQRVTQALHIPIVSETRHDYLCMCPFHENNVTPSFSISKSNGKYICFNGSCNRKGTLIDLVMELKRIGYFPAMRFIAGAEPTPDDVAKEIASRIEHKEEFPVFRQEVIDRMHADLLKNAEAMKYVLQRGLTKETVEEFELGYSRQKPYGSSDALHLLAIPMHDEEGNPVGVIGRNIHQKAFKNSVHLPGSKTLWNAHRARSRGRVVVVESSIDAMKLWQLGHNAVAILSGSLSKHHVRQLTKFFDHVIIMSDDDDPKFYPNCRRCKGINGCYGHNPGRELGRNIEQELLDTGSGVRVEWAVGKNPGDRLYDRGVKDAGEMTNEEIDFAVRNAWSVYDFRLLDNR